LVIICWKIYLLLGKILKFDQIILKARSYKNKTLSQTIFEISTSNSKYDFLRTHERNLE
jgi:hypothetical protein